MLTSSYSSFQIPWQEDRLMPAFDNKQPFKNTRKQFKHKRLAYHLKYKEKDDSAITKAKSSLRNNEVKVLDVEVFSLPNEGCLETLFSYYIYSNIVDLEKKVVGFENEQENDCFLTQKNMWIERCGIVISLGGIGYWTCQMIEKKQIDAVYILCCLGFSFLLAEIYTGRWYKSYIKHSKAHLN